jgi:hypothetical protein
MTSVNSLSSSSISLLFGTPSVNQPSQAGSAAAKVLDQPVGFHAELSRFFHREVSHL